jgi:hypothetical protein
MSYINEKSLHISGNNFKSLEFFEKASNHIKKSSVPVKASDYFKKGLIFSENASKKNCDLYKSLNFSENIFKMPQILKHKQASNSQKKKRFVAIAAFLQWPVRPCN